MIERPAFRPDILVTVIPGEGVVLTSEVSSHVLSGAVHEGLAGAMNGSRTTDELVDALVGHNPAHVYYALMSLETAGHLVDGAVGDGEASSGLPTGPRPDSDASGDAGDLGDVGGPGPEQVREPVQVVSVGDVPSDAISAELQARGLSVGADGHPRLVLADDYLHPDLETLNREAVESGTPWLLARPVGRITWVGPWFTPGEGPCWACLASRLRRNRPLATYLARRAGSTRLPTPPALWTEASLREGIRQVAARVERRAGDSSSIVTIDSADGVAEDHRLVRRPQCPVCGDAEITGRRMREPIRLASRPKAYTTDGGHRAEPPEATVRRFEEHVGPVTGVVGQLRRMTIPGWGDDEGDAAQRAPIHLFMAGGNQAQPGPDLDVFRRSLRSWSGGKGISGVQAKASALGEAIERYSGVYQGDEPRVRATLNELGDEAIHPNACMLYSDAQYRERDRLNASGPRTARIPLPFDPDASVDWSPVWSLTERMHRYLPTGYLFFQYPTDRDTAMCWADSNGAAAGNTVEEAILQGFLELVERDAVAIWWYNRVQRPGVDLESLDQPYWSALRDRYRRRGRDLWAIDITTDLGIPCYVAVTRRTEGEHEEILLGLGAHLDPAIAVSRALTEANQMLGSQAVAGSSLREGSVARWLRDATVAGHSYLLPGGGVPTNLGALPRLHTDDIGSDVETCRRIVEQRGMEVLVVDQTRADIEVPVVKVIVPGLRPFRPRFFPGRLYDVPCMLRWLGRPLPESEMNPIAFFL